MERGFAPLHSRDGWLEALDAVLAVQVRHPVWTSRLAELHGVVVEGAGVDRALLDALVERFPLDG